MRRTANIKISIFISYMRNATAGSITKRFAPFTAKSPMTKSSRGLNTKKGKYVEIESGQLDALRTPKDERTLTIDAFVKPDAIDPVYFDGRMYYLLPANKGSQDPYSVMVTAMRREDCYGVGQVVFSGKEQLALIRPLDNLLHLAMLNYSEEITPPDRVGHELKKPTSMERQLKLAQTLIRDWSDDKFDFSRYEDTYQIKLRKLIASKVKGHKLVVPKKTEREPATISLMDALKKSC